MRPVEEPDHHAEAVAAADEVLGAVERDRPSTRAAAPMREPSSGSSSLKMASAGKAAAQLADDERVGLAIGLVTGESSALRSTASPEPCSDADALAGAPRQRDRGVELPSQIHRSKCRGAGG